LRLADASVTGILELIFSNPSITAAFISAIVALLILGIEKLVLMPKERRKNLELRELEKKIDAYGQLVALLKGARKKGEAVGEESEPVRVAGLTHQLEYHDVRTLDYLFGRKARLFSEKILGLWFDLLRKDTTHLLDTIRHRESVSESGRPIMVHDLSETQQVAESEYQELLTQWEKLAGIKLTMKEAKSTTHQQAESLGDSAGAPYQEIIEKLNMSRLDTTVLYTVPFALFLVSASFTWLSDLLSKTFGTASEIWQGVMIAFVLSPMSIGIIVYLAAYLRDNLRLRFVALNAYLLGIWFAIPLLVGYPCKVLLGLVERAYVFNVYLGVVSWSYILLGVFGYGFILAGLSVSRAYWNGIIGWLGTHTREKFKEHLKKFPDPDMILAFSNTWAEPSAGISLRKMRKRYSFILTGAFVILLAAAALSYLTGNIKAGDGDILLIGIAATATAAMTIYPHQRESEAA